MSALLGKLPDSLKASSELISGAKSLDKHYIPTRYPNGFESGAPTDFYTREEAERAIEHARAIVEFCRWHIPSPQGD